MGKKQKQVYHPYQESHWRSITKAITWRFLATLSTFLITYFVIVSRHKASLADDGVDRELLEQLRKQARHAAIEDAMSLAGIVAGIELVIKLVLYYLHERIWQSVNVGWIRRYNRSRRIKKIRRKRLANEQ